MEKELSVILVNYNDKTHLQGCLSSLVENGRGFAFEIIIVDNNSGDGSPEFIEKNFPAVNLIRNQENVGFSRANNQAIRISRGEFILFLNTDTLLSPNVLKLLLEEMKANPQIGALGPALFRDRTRYQVSFGKKVSFFSEILQKCFLNHYYRLLLKIVQKKREVGWLSAACLLVRRSALEEAGFFDEKFFLYFEDIDLCLKMRERGWKLIFFPRAKVFHEGGVSTLSFKLSSRLEYRRSQLYYYRKHNSKISLFLLRLYLRLNFSFLSLWIGDSQVRSQYFQLLKE